MFGWCVGTGRIDPPHFPVDLRPYLLIGLLDILDRLPVNRQSRRARSWCAAQTLSQFRIYTSIGSLRPPLVVDRSVMAFNTDLGLFALVPALSSKKDDGLRDLDRYDTRPAGDVELD